MPSGENAGSAPPKVVAGVAPPPSIPAVTISPPRAKAIRVPSGETSGCDASAISGVRPVPSAATVDRPVPWEKSRNTMRAPSAVQDGLFWMLSPPATTCRPLPLAFTTTMSWLTLLPSNAIRVPSGDQAGLWASTVSNVSRVWPLPSAFMT